MSLKHVVQGYSNSALDSVGKLSSVKKKIADERMGICKKCPIFDSSTNICQKDQGGCGCLMTKKVYAMDASCPQKKWKPANI